VTAFGLGLGLGHRWHIPVGCSSLVKALTSCRSFEGFPLFVLEGVLVGCGPTYCKCSMWDPSA
jgi:hypothetical protein